MTEYQVIRPFSGHEEIGAILRDSDFLNTQRVTQLVDTRYLTKLSQSANVQPTAQALNDATIRRLSDLLPTVVDAGVIRAALDKETRESAIKALNSRLSEMEQSQ